MKEKILVICILMLMGSACQDKTSDLDEVLFECYDSIYSKEGYDIKSIIDDYEHLLVKDGILKDDSGSSYMEVWQKIVSDKDFRIQSSTFQEYDPWQKVNREIGVTVFECEYEMVESLKQKNSKMQKLFSGIGSLESSQNPDQTYQAMMEILSEEDLNSYYFKLKMFRLFDMVNSKWENQP
ncbi:hypothetical protein [Flagellimonas beolgyonensis]|uniref:hypothetical protein n=1 Tax=Flagellimonas beolgyonensis TaxID=864064 RepID=UPI003D64F7B6